MARVYSESVRSVGGETYSWKEGEDVLLDDTFVHEVWNTSKNRRVVLFCDVLRDKSLLPLLRKVNTWYFHQLGKSRKLAKAVKRAELPKDIVKPGRT